MIVGGSLIAACSGLKLFNPAGCKMAQVTFKRSRFKKSWKSLCCLAHLCFYTTHVYDLLYVFQSEAVVQYIYIVNVHFLPLITRLF